MNRRYRNLMIILVMIAMLVVAVPSKVNAGLQANKGGSSLYTATANNFFVWIRGMEEQYGTLGKNANIDTTTYLDSTGNGIDCHMVLNTEFGTAGILPCSEYGLKPNQYTKGTTTGNASGIYNFAYKTWEYVAGIYSSTNDYTNKIGNADSRYYNKYASNVSIPGDGIGKLGFSSRYPSSNSYPIIIRSFEGILSTSTCFGGQTSGYDYNYRTTRAVVVCGSGL